MNVGKRCWKHRFPTLVGGGKRCEGGTLVGRWHGGALVGVEKGVRGVGKCERVWGSVR